jgi:hypothetical protein
VDIESIRKGLAVMPMAGYCLPISSSSADSSVAENASKNIFPPPSLLGKRNLQTSALTTINLNSVNYFGNGLIGKSAAKLAQANRINNLSSNPTHSAQILEAQMGRQMRMGYTEPPSQLPAPPHPVSTAWMIHQTANSSDDNLEAHLLEENSEEVSLHAACGFLDEMLFGGLHAADFENQSAPPNSAPQTGMSSNHQNSNHNQLTIASTSARDSCEGSSAAMSSTPSVPSTASQFESWPFMGDENKMVITSEKNNSSQQQQSPTAMTSLPSFQNAFMNMTMQGMMMHSHSVPSHHQTHDHSQINRSTSMSIGNQITTNELPSSRFPSFHNSLLINGGLPLNSSSNGNHPEKVDSSLASSLSNDDQSDQSCQDDMKNNQQVLPQTKLRSFYNDKPIQESNELDTMMHKRPKLSSGPPIDFVGTKFDGDYDNLLSFVSESLR